MLWVTLRTYWNYIIIPVFKSPRFKSVLFGKALHIFVHLLRPCTIIKNAIYVPFQEKNHSVVCYNNVLKLHYNSHFLNSISIYSFHKSFIYILIFLAYSYTFWCCLITEKAISNFFNKTYAVGNCNNILKLDNHYHSANPAFNKYLFHIMGFFCAPL